MVKSARQYAAEGCGIVVDMDSEKFFDRVNHDLLMEKLSKKIDDGRVHRLIRRYLEAGMMAEGIIKRLADKVRDVIKGTRGRSLTNVITELNSILRGWMAYFMLTGTKKALEELNGWIRHKLRRNLWRQWKRPYSRAKNLMKAGLTEEWAFRSAFNQRGRGGTVAQAT